MKSFVDIYLPRRPRQIQRQGRAGSKTTKMTAFESMVCTGLEKSLKIEKLWDVLEKSLNFPQKSLNIFENSLNKK